MNLTLILALGGALAVGGILLKQSYTANGGLQTALNTATQRLTEINNVHKEMDAVHGTNNALSDDALFNGLLPTTAGDKR